MLKFESFSKSIIVYHGSRDKIEEVKPGLFTTTNKDGALWYTYNNYDVDTAYLTTFRLVCDNPLYYENLEGFQKMWLPILDELGYEYEFDNDDGHGWEFYCSTIEEHSPFEGSNPFDCVYLPGFNEKVLEMGYDCIYGYDVMNNYEIEIYIILNTDKITITKSEVINIKEEY